MGVRRGVGPSPGASAGAAPPADGGTTRWQRRRATAIQLGAISVGGGLGALSRWGLAVALPQPAPQSQPGELVWSTALANVLGCFLIGVVMVLVTDVWPHHRLIRPFVGIGVLGGFTTFSTYVVDTYQLAEAGAVATALGYLAGTVAAALPATVFGLGLARTVLRWRRVR